ncbi:TlpA family protein disulfide reductase [Polaribacter vadi]|uniref:TlpA family protein disulfide reductase n=1 Tax=Polaribacter TaxID=52959 RepID=UPI001C08B67B|nr:MULTISPECIES: TlpA disulfide reductase family protein [Polaribacter]MBU3010463.1 TlpA family protein disulfide reductase [Polaribacter vadi]MDO6740271.1 TlpA disulfide reductase family protein [Polaribacter sp. 1_MG-2023]
MKKIIYLFVFLSFYSCKKNDIKQNDIIIEKENSINLNQINFDNYLFNTLNNQQEKIELEKGKKYILDFWYLECPPCVKQHQEIKEHQNLLAKNNIEVIGVSIDRNLENWISYINKHQYNWKNYNQYSQENEIKTDYKIKLFPTYLYINDEGVILKKLNSFQELITSLELVSENK